MDGSVKGSPFQSQAKRRGGNPTHILEASGPPGSAQRASIDFHKIKVGETGLQGAKGEKLAWGWRPTPFSHHHGDRAGCPAGSLPTQGLRLLQREGQEPKTERRLESGG